jgi:hypothetical protein
LTLPSLSELSDIAPPLAQSAPGVLDADALARLQALDPEGKAGLVVRVLATYTQSLQRLLEQIRVARRDADVQQQRLVAHTLKSSSASVGALKLSALCAEVERGLCDGMTGELTSRFDDLIAEGTRVLAALQRH